MTPLALGLIGLGLFLGYTGFTGQSVTGEIRAIITGNPAARTRTTTPEQRAAGWLGALRQLGPATGAYIGGAADALGPAANVVGMAGLDPSLARPLGQLIAAVRAEGGTLTIVSGRRTRAQQIALRKTNGCPDIYESPASACKVPTARPGESKHETGRAVDLSGSLTIAHRLMGRYGLATPVPGEPWHFELAR